MHTLLLTLEKLMEMTLEDVTHGCVYMCTRTHLSNIFPIVTYLAETLVGMFCSSKYAMRRTNMV